MNEHIEKLIARFRQIAEERMQGLPFYNEQLQVEAVGFTAIDHGYIGALITPWFINIMLLFDQQPASRVVIGHRYTHKLPSGERDFMIGDDEVIGRYDFISLASPTGKYKTQQQAQTFALNKLNALLSPEGAEVAEVQPVSFVSRSDAGMSRRSFLAGKKSKD